MSEGRLAVALVGAPALYASAARRRACESRPVSQAPEALRHPLHTRLLPCGATKCLGGPVLRPAR
jgi:hypothetical protein